MQKYNIAWKSLKNGRVGKGTLAFSQEDGAKTVEELNTDYPSIHHWLVSVETGEPAVVKKELSLGAKAPTPGFAL